MLEQMIEGYEEALSNPAIDYRDFDHVAKPVEPILNKALRRKWRNLAEERIENVKPTIPKGKRSWALSDEEKTEIGRRFQTSEARNLVTCLRYREAQDEVEVLDAAYWVKGCSSLGRLRYVVLLRIAKCRSREFLG
jgi:uncharacterized protein (DUF2252 family)